MLHLHHRTVRFGDCDPAGIAYFPRFFDWFHQAMESWFDEALGLPYAQVITQQKLGFPAVHTEADFKAPCALGEQITVGLRVERLGGGSLVLGYEVRGVDGSLRATGRTVVAVTELRDSQLFSRKLDGELRERIQAFMGG